MQKVKGNKQKYVRKQMLTEKTTSIILLGEASSSIYAGACFSPNKTIILIVYPLSRSKILVFNL